MKLKYKVALGATAIFASLQIAVAQDKHNPAKNQPSASNPQKQQLQKKHRTVFPSYNIAAPSKPRP
jgi:hypothetical protein